MKKLFWAEFFKAIGQIAFGWLKKKFLKKKTQIMEAIMEQQRGVEIVKKSKPEPVTQRETETAAMRRKRKRIIRIERPRSMTPAELAHYKEFKNLKNFNG